MRNRAEPETATEVLLVGRLPSRGTDAMQGQYRVTLNVGRYLPLRNKLVTSLKGRGWLTTLFRWGFVRRTLGGVEFEELSIARLLFRMASSRIVFVTAGYNYGLLACAARALTLGRTRVVQRTGGFVRMERQVARSLREERGNGLRHVLMEYLVLRFANLVVVNSALYESVLVSTYPFLRDSLVVVPNGIDPALLPDWGNTTAGRVRSEKPLEILTVAGLFGIKGIDVVLEAYALLAVRTHTRLTIVGDGLPGIAQAIADASDSLADEPLKAIRHIPSADTTTLRRLYASAHCYVQLSRFDAGPSTILEAYAYGLPILASRYVGVHPAIESSAAFWRCTLNPQEVSERLAEVVDLLPSLGRETPDVQELRWQQLLARLVPHLIAAGRN